MATQTTPFQGSKFYFGVGFETEKAITACTVTPSATITVANSGFKTGDYISITGLSAAIDGFYPVKSVATDVVTLADEVDWESFDKPTDFTKAKVAKIKLSDNFCAITSISFDGGTRNKEDITTICSKGSEYQSNELELGTIKLDFYFSPATTIQQDLRKKHRSGETFPWLMVFMNKQGSVYGSGFAQSVSFDGEVKGKLKGSITIENTKLENYLPATV